ARDEPRGRARCTASGIEEASLHVREEGRCDGRRCARMSNSSLDFDDVAADDALIESLRAGASVDELPSDDAAADLLVSLRDGASAEDEVRTEVAVPARAAVSGVISHRRSIAVTAIVGVLTTAGDRKSVV